MAVGTTTGEQNLRGTNLRCGQRLSEGRLYHPGLIRGSATGKAATSLSRLHVAVPAELTRPTGAPSQGWQVHPPTANAGELEKLPKRAFSKQKLCQYWSQNGHCTHGANCTFAHGDDELGTYLTDVPPPFVCIYAYRYTGTDQRTCEIPRKTRVLPCTVPPKPTHTPARGAPYTHFG